MSRDGCPTVTVYPWTSECRPLKVDVKRWSGRAKDRGLYTVRVHCACGLFTPPRRVTKEHAERIRGSRLRQTRILKFIHQPEWGGFSRAYCSEYHPHDAATKTGGAK